MLRDKLFKGYLEEGEELIHVLHHHVLSTLKPVLLNITLYILVPSLVWYAIPDLRLLWIVIIIFGSFKTISTLVSWYYNALLVTDVNLIDLEWHGIFHREATRIEYRQVESFSYEVNGVINTIFKIGNIEIMKLNGTVNEIKGVFNPQRNSQLLTKLQDEIVNQNIRNDHDALKGILTNMIQDHIKENGITIYEE
jgi:hypothetical protein